MNEVSTETGAPPLEAMDADSPPELNVPANDIEQISADVRTEVEETLKTEDEEPSKVDNEEAGNEVIQEAPEENVPPSSEP